MNRLMVLKHLDPCGYDPALRLQRKLVEELKAAETPDYAYLLLLQHHPVITVGRSGSDDNVLARPEELERRGVEVRETNRGGDVTYHGPGQVVGYPIISLLSHGKDVHAYMRRLESVLIGTLARYGIDAHRVSRKTGVWVGDEKVASIGIAVTRWVAWHGFALNVSTGPADFELIRPCGLEGVKMTSMEELLGRAVEIDEVADVLAQEFAREFGMEVEPADIEGLAAWTAGGCRR